ncbi:hypothetical protein Taro_011728 [Colocasia esculenta]|uniref:Uncharacterized protein n=1 Tax=Colocasia esculenta TaxID=4460 RepID=A0A843U260_COLES|nr:hypothetical protein [Colocasia esculenta]
MASLLFSSPALPCARFSSSPSPSSRRNPRPNPRATIACPSRWKRLRRGGTPTEQRPIAVRFAVAGSESPKPLGKEEPLLPLLQELADSLDLPPDYLAKLPRDLRLDLNDAAFDLSNGPVLDECGQDLGEMLLNLAKSWEQADTSTSRSIAMKLPLLQDSLNNNVKAAFGRRLVSAGRRFQSMGGYGEGELQRVYASSKKIRFAHLIALFHSAFPIANAMTETGKVLSTSPVTSIDKEPKKEIRVFKFGELQVELTPEKANIGAAIAFVFGFLSWQLSQGIQSIPESSLQYANDNALLLAKSLRGALLALFYSSTVLSAFASVGLVLLGRQLSSKSEDKSQDK